VAVRPLYNGSARVGVDNGQAGGLRNAFVFRASTAAIDTGVETVANATFEAEAGQSITLNYDIRKFGDALEQGTPTFAVIRVYNDDDNNDARTGAVAESADLIGGNVLPRTGAFNFTPGTAGTYRVQLEMQKDNGDFGATSDDWRAQSDGNFQRGALANPTQAFARDKGRIRAGLRVLAGVVTRQDGSPAPTVFAFTMNAAGTAAEEGVQATITFSHDSNKTTANEIYRLSAVRDGTNTVDVTTDSVRIAATQHRITRTITQIVYPVLGPQLYDGRVTVENASALHANNTRQYDALGGQAANGGWTYFTGATAPMTLIDYRTAERQDAYTVNSSGSIEDIHCAFSDEYAEDGAQIPTSTERADYVATDKNMTVKSGRVLNARGEPLRGLFLASSVVHEASGVGRDSWGQDATAFKTLANGWQDDARVVVVSTPPAGVHKVTAEAYFPSGTLATPASRQFYATRIEDGAPASVDDGKNWIAPASFSNAILVIRQVNKGGVVVALTVKVYNKDAAIDADAIPTCQVFKNRSAVVHASPVLTKRPDVTGVYDGEFTPDAVSSGVADTYEIAITVAVSGFTRRYGDAIDVVAFDLAKHVHGVDPSLLDTGRAR
jgi:hypothetical protein